MFVNSNLCVWIPAVLVNRIETRRPAFRRGFCPVLCPGCCSGLFYVRFGRVRGARNPVVGSAANPLCGTVCDLRQLSCKTANKKDN